MITDLQSFNYLLIIFKLVYLCERARVCHVYGILSIWYIVTRWRQTSKSITWSAVGNKFCV